MARITAALDDLGPMMCTDIARHLGLQRDRVSSAMVRMTTHGPILGRRAHISGWSHSLDELRHYPRAIYALGDQPDARKPRLKTVFEVNRDSRARRRAKVTMNFVFNLRAPYQKQRKQGALA